MTESHDAPFAAWVAEAEARGVDLSSASVRFWHEPDDPRTLVADRANRYSGTVHHVHDGDTVYALVWSPVDQHYVLVGCRIRGVQAPELRDPGGPEVRDLLAARLPVGEQVVIGDVGPYPRAGHVTCSLTTADGTDVATWLVVHQYAVEWDGRGARPKVPWPPEGI